MKKYLIVSLLSLAFIGLILFDAPTFSILKFDSQADSISTPVYDLWFHWKNQHSKNYGYAEDKFRIKVFNENLKFVSEFGEKNPNATHTVEMNRFSDLTHAEFKRFYLGLDTTFLNSKKREDYFISALAPSVDWRQKGAVSAIKDQGQCGNCWAFSSVGALESLYEIKTGTLEEFSEQQIIDCSGAFGNMGCNGGFMNNVFEYTEEYGIESESDYHSTDGSCQYNASKVVFKNTGYVSVPARDLDQLAAAVNLQPVTVGVNAESWQFYSGGILSECSSNLDHGVLLVGYGNQGSSDYWILKNSWGTSWGEQGYIRISKTSGIGDGTCGIALAASYPTWDKSLDK